MKHKAITYTGPLADGIIADPHTGATYNFKRGEAVTLPETITGSLLSSGQWEEAAKKTPPAKDN